MTTALTEQVRLPPRTARLHNAEQAALCQLGIRHPCINSALSAPMRVRSGRPGYLGNRGNRLWRLSATAIISG